MQTTQKPASRAGKSTPAWHHAADALEVLAAANKRDRGNRNGTWTAHEISVADEIDDAYMQDDLCPPLASCLSAEQDMEEGL